MIANEVISKFVNLGICYQIHSTLNKNLLDSLRGVFPGGEESKEDFTKTGYNVEEDVQDNKKPSLIEVISDKEQLKLYDGWHLALKIPKEFPQAFTGPLMTAYLDEERHLIIQGDDVPFGNGAIKHSFNLEYIKDIKFTHNVLSIETVFGVTAILLKE